MSDKKPKKTGKKNGPRVLLVEDDPVLALDLEAALFEQGAAQVVVCASMSATVVELDKARPDFVILDVHLSDRNDGWALAELISLLGPKRPRIAFATGSPEDIPASARAMGPVFEKPYDPAQLAEELLGGQKIGIIARIRGVLG